MNIKHTAYSTHYSVRICMRSTTSWHPSTISSSDLTLVNGSQFAAVFFVGYGFFLKNVISVRTILLFFRKTYYQKYFWNFRILLWNCKIGISWRLIKNIILWTQTWKSFWSKTNFLNLIEMFFFFVNKDYYGILSLVLFQYSPL